MLAKCFSMQSLSRLMELTHCPSALGGRHQHGGRELLIFDLRAINY